jgi:hypothetical protein
MSQHDRWGHKTHSSTAGQGRTHGRSWGKAGPGGARRGQGRSGWHGRQAGLGWAGQVVMGRCRAWGGGVRVARQGGPERGWVGWGRGGQGGTDVRNEGWDRAGQRGTGRGWVGGDGVRMARQDEGGGASPQPSSIGVSPTRPAHLL